MTFTAEQLQQACPEAMEGHGYFDAPGYDQMLALQDITIVQRTMFGSYQGDYVYLLHDGDRYGWLVVGYGSCSGCDALMACSNYQHLAQLYTAVYSNIRWGNAAELYAWLRQREQWLDWYSYEDEVQTFKQQILLYLKERSSLLVPPDVATTGETVAAGLGKQLLAERQPGDNND